jgi:chemotaxis-related protein WspB
VLFLLFQLGDDRYALDARQVVEVLPLVEFKQIPQAPPAILGAFNYRGTATPLLDLSQLALGRPAQARLSTRIVVLDFSDGEGRSRLLGLLAERVSETLRRDASQFQDAGVDLPEARYLGPVTTDEQGLVQWVRVEQLLSPDVRLLLFQPQAAG